MDRKPSTIAPYLLLFSAISVIAISVIGASEPPPAQAGQPHEGVWLQLRPLGNAPPIRFEHSAIFDPARKRYIVFGGRPCQNIRFNDVWALSLDGVLSWEQLNPTGDAPIPRKGQSAIYDPVRDRMVIYGGNKNTFPFTADDVWALNLSGPPTWTEIVVAGPKPPPRSNHTAVYDLAQDRLVLFGGRDPSNCALGDTWSLLFGAIDTWAQHIGSGEVPDPRVTTSIHDIASNRMTLFGGYTTPGRGCGILTIFDDVWELQLGDSLKWSERTIDGNTPAARVSSVSAYDSVRHGMVIFGGTVDAFTTLTDTWFLPLTTPGPWVEVSTGGIAPANFGTGFWGAIHDPIGDRMVVLNEGFLDCRDPNSNPYMESWSLYFGFAAGSAEPVDPRGMGFWKHQCSSNGFKQISSEELDQLFSDVALDSPVFPECVSLGCESFADRQPQNQMRPKAEKESLALWLNLVSDRLTLETLGILPGANEPIVLEDALEEIESTLCDPHSTRSQLGRIKDLAETFNRRGEDMELQSETSSLQVERAEQVSVEIALINSGSYPSDYEVSVTSPWAVQLSKKTISSLAPGQAAILTAVISVPESVPPGERRSVLIRAYDVLGDSHLEREIELTLLVQGPESNSPRMMLPPD